MNIVISKSGQLSKPFLEKIRLVKGDIAQQEVDAIAIVISQNMDFKGKINERVREACGVDLDEFILENIYKPRPGEVYALPGFGLPARHILLGILPHYRNEFDMNEAHLSGLARKYMEIGRSMLLKTIAFPPIASGKKGFQKPKAARLIIQGVTDRLDEGFEEVRLVCPDDRMHEIFLHKLDVVGWRP